MHRNVLKWLLISYQIKLRSTSVAAMSRYYRQKGCLLLHPPILYGRQRSYRTCCKEYFASVDLCRLASTKRHFRFAATTRPWPIMLKILPIMLLSIAQKICPLCSICS